MTLRKFLIILTALTAIVAVSGCSGGQMRSIMECIPQNVVAVRAIDLNSLFKEAGIPTPVKGDTLVADGDRVLELVTPPVFRNLLTQLLAVPGAVDFSGMVLYTDAAGRDVIVLPVSDRKLFSAILHDGEVRHTDGLTFRIIDDMTLATDERGLCLVAPDIMTIVSSLADSNNSNFGDFSGLRQFLFRKSSAVNIAVNCGNSPLNFLGGNSRWLCLSFNVTRESVSMIGKLMNRDGDQYPIGASFDEIDTDFLRYTPENASVVLAFGRFSGNVRGLSMLLGRFAPMYLAQADGTTSLYALPASGNPEAVAGHMPGSWNVETMVHLPEDQIEIGLEQYVSRAGGEVSEVGYNQWEYSSDGNNYYFGAFDGALVFSTNREIYSDYNNGLSDDFLGKRAAMVIDVPSGSVLARAWGLAYGLTLKIGVETDNFKARVTFNGSDMSALRSLLYLPQLSDLQAQFNNTLGL